MRGVKGFLFGDERREEVRWGIGWVYIFYLGLVFFLGFRRTGVWMIVFDKNFGS